jgi:hypothetical protein
MRFALGILLLVLGAARQAKGRKAGVTGFRRVRHSATPETIPQQR